MALSSEIRSSIQALSQAGLSNVKIARQLQISVSTVGRTLKRIQELGNLSDRPRSGRPGVLSDRQKRLLPRLLRSGSIQNASQVRKKLELDYGINTSVSTVQRSLRSLGYVSRIKKKRPLLTAQHKKRRLAFAKAHRTWTVDDWKMVIFSDETKFNLLNSDGKEYYWTKTPGILSRDAVKQTKKYGGGKVLVWGCMSWEGVSFFSINKGTMNSELYQSILEDQLKQTMDYYSFKYEDMIFQQDNDPKHISKSTKDYLKKLNFSKILDWPSQSPDLNPIEHLWNFYDQKLKSHSQLISSVKKMEELLEEMFQDSEKEVCRKLISTMPERIQDVINSRGGYTRW